jgi:phospholipid transport system substrate-binding protein
LDITYKYYKPKRPKKDKDEWLVYDVEILGVSVLKSDRAQFKEYLVNHTFAELMQSLQP